MTRSLMLAHAVIAAQMANLQAVGLPAPGTSEARRLGPLLPQPELDARAPEIRQERAQMREAVKLSRRQQRRQKQEKRRTEKAVHQLARSSGPAFPFGVPTVDANGMPVEGYPQPGLRPLDLSLIHEPRRRAKLTAISTATIPGRSIEDDT